MRRSVLMTGGLVLLVLLLVGAAFVGGRLLNQQEQGDDGGEMFVVDGVGETAYTAKSLEIQSAGEMPAAPPEVAGVFVGREDNSFFVGTGNVNFMVSGSPAYDGPEIEVLITRDTLIFSDDTWQQFSSSPPSGPVQQVLNPGSLDEIGKNSTVSAWGERRGDRVVAEVLVYVNSNYVKGQE